MRSLVSPAAALRLLGVAAALLLAGCPYAAQFPLGSPEEAILDAELLGTWRPSAAGEEDFTLTIRASAGALLTLEAESPGEDPASYPAFVSVIGAERFLNLRDAAESGLWYFANYRIEGQRLRLRLVEEELFESQAPPDAGELRDFLQRHLDDPRLYGGQEAQVWDWVLEKEGPSGS